MRTAAQLRSLWLYTLGVAGLRHQDVLLASFPRSGSTWVRFLLAHLINVREAREPAIDFPTLDRMMPALGANNLLPHWPHAAIPRVVKTHKPYLPLFRRQRAIGLIRDPRDVMVSFYHFQKDRKQRYAGSFADFIRNERLGLPSWFAHYSSWQAHWTLVVRYEDLKRDAFGEFNRILTVLGVSYPAALIQEVISRSTLQNTREAEKSTRPAPKPEAQFARSGQTGQWLAYFAAQDLTYYRELAEQHDLKFYRD